MAETEATRSIAEISTTHEWQLLTTQQRAFVSRYISNGVVTGGTYDSQDAVTIAYPNCDPTNRKVLACQLLRKKRVQRVIDLHFRRTLAESLLLETRLLLSRARRRGANTDVMIPALLRLTKALEAHAAKHTPDAGIIGLL